MKEFEPKKEQKLPPNVTLAWGRSDVCYGEITYLPPDRRHTRIQRIEHAPDRQFSDDEWKSLLGEVLFQARENPQNLYHFMRLDHKDFVAENSNNQPFSASNNWTKRMSMFGWCYERNYEGDNDGSR